MATVHIVIHAARAAPSNSHLCHPFSFLDLRVHLPSCQLRSLFRCKAFETAVPGQQIFYILCIPLVSVICFSLSGSNRVVAEKVA